MGEGVSVGVGMCAGEGVCGQGCVCGCVRVGHFVVCHLWATNWVVPRQSIGNFLFTSHALTVLLCCYTGARYVLIIIFIIIYYHLLIINLKNVHSTEINNIYSHNKVTPQLLLPLDMRMVIVDSDSTTAFIMTNLVCYT